jgi:hypothetical protein
MSVLNPTTPAHTAAPRLVLNQTGAKNTLLDGAWWPQSNDPEAELPGLVLALDGLKEPVSRLILHAGDWAEHVIKLTVGERVVRAGYFASQPVGLLTAICGRDLGRFDLLVVPPDTDPEVAEAAMRRSVADGNQVHAQDILRSVQAEAQPRR